MELTDKDIKIIVQSLKIWRGDFPETKCEPSLIWQRELTELINRLGASECKIQNELERAAKKCTRTGNRSDLQEYLKLRRNYL